MGKLMKTNFMRLCSILLWFPIYFSSLNSSAAPKPFSIVSKIGSDQTVAQDLDNNGITFPNKSGKWIVLNYWADWCGPCKREIPALNEFYKNNQDKVIFVSVHTDLLDQKDLKKIARNLNIQFPMLQSDPLKLVGALEGTPSTYFISPLGQVYGPLLGPQNERSLLKAIQQFS